MYSDQLSDGILTLVLSDNNQKADKHEIHKMNVVTSGSGIGDNNSHAR
jgi:hypothetical protein